ncbi:MAG: hypothetical protein ACTSUI_01980 [Promethearchaeota archaeon]
MSFNSKIPLQLFYQFPWLNGSSEILFYNLGLNDEQLEDITLPQTVTLLFEKFPDLKNRIIKFYENIANSNEIFSTPTSDIENLAMYPLLQLITAIVGDRIFANALTNIYAKHCQKILTERDAIKKYPDKLIEYICQNLEINCKYHPKNFIENVDYPFQMSFNSFLKSATKIKDESWKLINRRFFDGKVFLIRHDVIFLLRETVRIKVRPDFAQMTPDLKEDLKKIPQINDILGEIEELVVKYTTRFQSSLFSESEKIGSEFFPPCIRVILYRVVHGENLSHNERLAIAFYYLNTNHSIEETVDIFRTSPDFDEKIARYQVEFASGKGGKGKKYSMFNCPKMKSLHMCFAADPKFGDKICVNGMKKRNGEIATIQHPIKDYIFWKKVEKNRLLRSQVALGEKILEKSPTTNHQSNSNSNSNQKSNSNSNQKSNSNSNQKSNSNSNQKSNSNSNQKSNSQLSSRRAPPS